MSYIVLHSEGATQTLLNRKDKQVVTAIKTMPESRNAKLNIRLSDRERLTLEAEANAQEIQNLSVWTRKTLLDHVANFGRSADWFLQGEVVVLGKAGDGGVFVSDGRAMYRVPSVQQEALIDGVLPIGVDREVLSKNPTVRFHRQDDRAETVVPLKFQMSDAIDSATNLRPAILRTLQGLPVIVEKENGLLLHAFDLEGDDEPRYIQRRYVRLIEHFSVGPISFKSGDLPSPLLAYDQHDQVVAAIMPFADPPAR